MTPGEAWQARHGTVWFDVAALGPARLGGAGRVRTRHSRHAEVRQVRLGSVKCCRTRLGRLAVVGEAGQRPVRFGGAGSAGRDLDRYRAAATGMAGEVEQGMARRGLVELVEAGVDRYGAVTWRAVWCREVWQAWPDVACLGSAAIGRCC
jgi:hypothetical protein